MKNLKYKIGGLALFFVPLISLLYFIGGIEALKILLLDIIFMFVFCIWIFSILKLLYK